MSQAVAERTTPQQPERFDPFDELERLRSMLEQTLGGVAAGTWAPPVDIEEQDDAYVLEAELPGIEREDIHVEQLGKELQITGEIKERERKGVLRRQTRRVGHFAYRVRLPEDVDASNIDAKLKGGVLTVRVPKAQRAERRQVEVKG